MQAIDHLISAIYGFWVQFLEKFRHEPDQTKSLGYILAKSDEAMKMFLSLIQINKKHIPFLTSLKWEVECEERIVLRSIVRILLFPPKAVHQCSKNIRHTAFVILNSSNSR